MGPATTSALEKLPGFADFVYSDPEFGWGKPVAPRLYHLSIQNRLKNIKITCL